MNAIAAANTLLGFGVFAVVAIALWLSRNSPPPPACP